MTYEIRDKKVEVGRVPYEIAEMVNLGWEVVTAIPVDYEEFYPSGGGGGGVVFGEPGGCYGYGPGGAGYSTKIRRTKTVLLVFKRKIF